jgi:hypothetical protein
MESTKVEEIILFCVNEGLFEIDENTNQLMCLKLLKHLDNTLSANPEIKKIMNNFNLNADPNSMNMPFIPGLFPMMNNPQNNIRGSPLQNN